MSARGRILTFLLAVAAIALLAAGLWWVLHPAPGPLRLSKKHFSDVPGWAASDPRDALFAFQKSCSLLQNRPDSASVGRYGGTVADWRGPCAAALRTNPDEARDFFEQRFVPLAVSAGRVKDGRFTGYFEPEIRGSRLRRGAFRTPVYERPRDLVTADLGEFRPSLDGEHIYGKVQDGKLVPYASRAEINARGLRSARVLFWTDDPIALFFLHIQGSGRVAFDDGSRARVAYAAQNGQPYTAIGKTLIARGVPREGMSLQVIRAWLKSHPDEARDVMETDASYIFFQEEPVGDPALGAKGAQGVPLTPLGSLAVDPRLHPLGIPVFVSGDMNRLFVAQDIGGAIRGAVRGDVYFGFGVKAEARAGTMDKKERMFVLVPKAVAQRMKAEIEFPETAP